MGDHLNSSGTAHASAGDIGAVDIGAEILLSPLDDVQDITLSVVVPDELRTLVALGNIDVVSQPEGGDGRHIVAGVGGLSLIEFSAYPDTVVE